MDYVEVLEDLEVDFGGEGRYVGSAGGGCVGGRGGFLNCLG
jgi:hypothetical protein